MNNRVDMIKKMRELFDISAKAPDSFDGIPTQNPMNASFCSFSENRSEDGKDIERLWNLFEKALQGEEDMEQDFNDVLKQMSIAVPKLTMGLFYGTKGKVTVQMMKRQDFMQYGETSKCQMVKLRYMCMSEQNKSFVMRIFLPKKGYTPDDVLYEIWNNESYLDMEEEEVKLSLPNRPYVLVIDEINRGNVVLRPMPLLAA